MPEEDAGSEVGSDADDAGGDVAELEAALAHERHLLAEEGGPHFIPSLHHDDDGSR